MQSEYFLKCKYCGRTNHYLEDWCDGCSASLLPPGEGSFKVDRDLGWVLDTQPGTGLIMGTTSWTEDEEEDSLWL